MTDEQKEKNGLAQLLEPFKEHEILKLPKPTISNEEWKKLKKEKCATCGGFHPATSVIHLPYVGHAALTKRLLMVDSHWNWEPAARTPEGLPAFDKNGGLWINLTVCGVTRLGYGHADGKNTGDGVKEVIGDALRNASMRFGAALDLWHKGDLYDAEEKRSMGWEVEEPDPKKDTKDDQKKDRKDPPPPVSAGGGKSAQQWADEYSIAIARLKTLDEMRQLTERNADALIRLDKVAPELRDRIEMALAEKRHQIEAAQREAELAPFK